jgi:hypothetical protein
MQSEQQTTRPRPQDLVFTREELERAFGPRLSREEWLRSFRRNAVRPVPAEECEDE